MCSACKNMYNVEQSLDKHYNQYHFNYDWNFPQIFKCDFKECNQIFLKIEELNKHKKIHRVLRDITSRKI